MQAGNVQKQVKNEWLLKSYYLGLVDALQIAEYVLFWMRYTFISFSDLAPPLKWR